MAVKTMASTGNSKTEAEAAHLKVHFVPKNWLLEEFAVGRNGRLPNAVMHPRKLCLSFETCKINPTLCREFSTTLLLQLPPLLQVGPVKSPTEAQLRWRAQKASSRLLSSVLPPSS